MAIGIRLESDGCRRVYAIDRVRIAGQRLVAVGERVIDKAAGQSTAEMGRPIDRDHRVINHERDLELSGGAPEDPPPNGLPV